MLFNKNVQEIRKLFNNLKSNNFFFFFLKYLSTGDSNIKNINIVNHEQDKVSVRKINLIEKLINYLIHVMILINVKFRKWLILFWSWKNDN